MATGKISLNSDLQRKKWVKDNLLANRTKSFWLPYTDKKSDAVVYKSVNSAASTGHTIVFDYKGYLTGKNYRRDDHSYGKGETKRKFSDKITVDEFSLYVDNGTKFDAAACDDLRSSEHSDSIDSLSDLYYRQKDQALFDVAQGSVVGNTATHIFDLGTNISFNDLIDIENAAKKGSGLVQGTTQGCIPSNIPAKRRTPLKGYKLEKGEDVYLCVIDTYSATKLKKDPDYQTLKAQGDVRGRNNANFSGVIGKLGNVVYVEAPIFFGTTEGKGMFTFFDTEIQFSGLRRYAVDGNTGDVYWEGQADFARIEDSVIAGTPEGDIYSRNLLLGAGALQEANGMMPNYELEWAAFKKSSQSMLEHWSWYKKTVLTLENGSDYDGAVTNLDFGVICLDIKHT